MLSIRDDNSDPDAGNVLHFKYYYYNPSLGAAALFLVLFLLVTSFHFFKMIRSKTWFMVPFCIGGVFEFIGYIGRIGGAKQSPDWTLGPYIIQALFLLVAPALFAASIYMELGRIVLMLDGQRALFIKRTWMTKIFVAGDVVSFMMQGAGGGLLSSGKVATIKTGKNVVVGGLVVQIIFFGLFVIAAALFHWRMNKNPTQQCYENPFWTKHMFGLYGVSLLIFWRSIVRVIEYAQGYDGYVITHEVYIYVFDGLLMFAAMCVMGWIHPAEVAQSVRAMRRSKQDGGEEGISSDEGMQSRDETRLNSL